MVTTTGTLFPGACAGVVAIMVVLVTAVTVAAVPPNVTVAPVRKPVPAIVTGVPPACVPLFGVTEVIAGGATKVKPLLTLADCPSRLVTTTVAGPAA